MFGWLKRRAQIAIVTSMETDLDRFLLGLRGASASEVGGIVACTYHWMNVLERQFAWNLEHPDLVTMQDMMAPLKVNRMIREVQSRNTAMAPGLMVWLHTLRASTTPEIRLKGRELWAQLSRGFPHAEHGAETFLVMVGINMDLSSLGRVPTNLTPLEQ